jgi:hypothetical protein
MSKKLDKAKQLLLRALAEGCTPEDCGNWIKFTPPPSSELAIELAKADSEALTQAVRDWRAA